MHTKQDRFISELDGFAVHFKEHKQDKYGNTDRARAASEVKAHDSALRKAAELRAGRPVTDKEIKTGILAAEDLRSKRDRIAEDARHNSVNNTEPGLPDASFNPYAAEVSRLEEKLAKTWREGDKRSVQNRLDLARQNAEKRQGEIERRKAFEANMNRPELKTCFAEAQFWVNRFRNDPSPECQEAYAIVVAAERDLIATGDSAAWTAKLNQALSDRKAKVEAVTQAMHSEIAALQADLTARQDLTPAPTE